MIIAETACNWFWEAEGTGAGVTGVGTPFGEAQQAPPQQCPDLQHAFVMGTVTELAATG